MCKRNYAHTTRDKRGKRKQQQQKKKNKSKKSNKNKTPKQIKKKDIIVMPLEVINNQKDCQIDLLCHFSSSI